MSNTRQSLPKRGLTLALLLTAAVAACDSSTTAPAGLRPAPTKPAAFDGDTIHCLTGWVIITGVVVCNEGG
jgi:hypothetical protein